MVKPLKLRVDTHIQANENFDKEPYAKDFPIQLNLWYAKNDDLTAHFKKVAVELSIDNVRFRRDSSKARYTYMCDIYFKDADTLNAFLRKTMHNIDMVEEKILEGEKTIYPYMFLDKARKIIEQSRGAMRA